MTFALKTANSQLDILNEVMSLHTEAMACRDIEDLLKLATQSWGWLKDADSQYRERVYAGDPRDTEIEEMHSTFRRRFLTAGAAVQFLAERFVGQGYGVDGLSQFIDLLSEVREEIDSQQRLARNAAHLRSMTD
jgi:hypothetical protein